MYIKQLLYEQNMEYPVLVVISTHAVVAIVVIIIQCVLCVYVGVFFSLSLYILVIRQNVRLNYEN